MRTTVELKPEHRAALIALAGERERELRKAALMAMAGVLTEEESAELRQQTGEIRESWR